MTWTSVANPPPLTESPYGWPSSVPVLGYFRDGTQRVVTLEQLDGAEAAVWYTNCSERWDISQTITDWQPLPPGPGQCDENSKQTRYEIRQQVHTVDKAWLEVIARHGVERSAWQDYERLVAAHPDAYFELIAVTHQEACLAFTPKPD